MPRNQDVAGELKEVALQLKRLTSLCEGLSKDIAKGELPDDPFKDGEVIKFEHRFNRGDWQTYTYVCLKVGDSWYITGRNGCVTWGNLYERFLSNPRTLNTLTISVKWVEAKEFIS